jgi:hypothetical protein
VLALYPLSLLGVEFLENSLGWKGDIRSTIVIRIMINMRIPVNYL